MKVWYLESRNGEERWVLNKLINIYICYYLQQQQNLMIKHFFNFWTLEQIFNKVLKNLPDNKVGTLHYRIFLILNKHELRYFSNLYTERFISIS